MHSAIRQQQQPMVSLHMRSLVDAVCRGEKPSKLSWVFSINTDGTGCRMGCQTCTIWVPSCSGGCAFTRLLERFFPAICRRVSFSLWDSQDVLCLFLFVWDVIECLRIKLTSTKMFITVNSSHGEVKKTPKKPSADMKSSDCQLSDKMSKFQASTLTLEISYTHIVPFSFR